MRCALGLILLAAGEARAERCRVHVDAPDELRAEIDRWVRAEPRCSHALEVQVAETQDGLLVEATDEDGRHRARVVADVQSVGPLVVSWAADDDLDETSALAVSPLGTIALPEPRDDEPVASHPTRRLLAVGAIAGADGIGLSARFDLFTRGAFALGVAGEVGSWEGGGAAAFVAYTRGFLRAQVGAGVRVGGGDHMRGPDASPALDAGVFARLPVARDWAIFAGPAAWVTPDGMSIVGVAGAEYRL